MCDLRAWVRVCAKLAGAMQSVCDLRRVHEMEAMQMLPGNVNWSLKTAVNVFLSLVHTARQATKGNRSRCHSRPLTLPSPPRLGERAG
jgi:hypothetical protein